MAASTKRKHEPDNKKAKQKRNLVSMDTTDKKLCEFLEWCEKNNFNISPKVQVSRKGSCAQYGMVAVEDIAESYCLFQVPRTCLLTPENSTISDLIEKDKSNLSATNQWIPLLIALLHEKNDPSSFWSPYLNLFPDFQSLNLPMFWEDSEVKQLLAGTGVDTAVERDIKMIQDDYNKRVVPFFDTHNQLSGDKRDLDLFKKMVAFVMAYSFTEPQYKEKDEGSDDEIDEEEEKTMSPPIMVPLADALNHITKNNAKLTFGEEALKMVSTRPIKKGEEIFNTYGQVSNLHLMNMYGFAEPYPDNTNDVVEIPVERVLEAAKDVQPTDSAFLDEKWEFLKSQEVVVDSDVIVLGQDGILTDETCTQVLKVITMNKTEFKDYREKEGWSDAESDSSVVESKLDFANLHLVESQWKSILKRLAEIHLTKYPTTLKEDQEKIKQVETFKPRDRFALYVAHSQKMLLHQLINLCK
ncbi:N-lysine methyltransferase SETD6-like [Physella acuta]|uniref:N-lysine methyltransferase SETD6-like n=1 Tax=Physella acuta TaxID=109671 RepID=UPI0027DE6787|nr:N-lysine methyltransferase SETD6-like [Physella acuta]